MDFDFTEEQEMLRDLAREILQKEVSLDLLKSVESGSEWTHSGLWARLAEANLLGVSIPEEHGGMGFAFLELCVLCEEIGRVTAPVPVFPTLVLGVLPVTQFGTPQQREALLPGVSRGEVVLSAALAEGPRIDPGEPATFATRHGDGWLIEGRKSHVSAANLATRILVTVASEDGVGILLVDPASPGVEMRGQRLTHGEVVFDLGLHEVWVGDEDVLGGSMVDGAAQIAWLYDHALVANCAVQAGVSQRALELTADFARERVQFGVPIGSFQAVQHRLADAFIDLEAMRWSLWRAAWRLNEGLPASREAMVAKFWAAEGGVRLANTAQHLHGGSGVDLDTQIHRHFLWTKHLELNLGSAMPQLVRLGRDMARTGPQELI
jgi:alkylation response protein AidB-like acyl-CoA dehydrogenase